MTTAMIAPTTKTTAVDSPIGPLRLASEDEVLTGLYMEDGRHNPTCFDEWEDDPTPFGAVIKQLNAYFSGDLTEFDLPIRPRGTAFQRQVWEGLCKIPYGETWSYGLLAGHVGNPRASRAVGLANGRNPIAIIVPCHRVIGANGTLTGYGGGLERKAWLLDHEARHGAAKRSR